MDSRRLARETFGGALLTLLLGSAASQAQDPCDVEPMRDYVYAGNRLLAAVGPLPPGTVSFAAESSTVLESAGTATATVKLATSDPHGLPCPLIVNYATSPQSASAGTDFTTTSGTLTFAAGSRTGDLQQVSVPVVNDAVNEAGETFLLALTVPAGGALGTPAIHTVTIADDDPFPAASIDDVTVTEGNAGSVSAVFSVMLSAPSGQTVALAYATADGTATAPGDYAPVSGTLVFPPGTTMQRIAVNVTGDTVYEHNETLFANLSRPSNVVLARAQGMGTITNDDLPQLAIGDANVTEASGTAVLTVTLSPASEAVATVAYRTLDGSATAGSDYATATGTLNFEPGVTVQTVAVAIVQDGVFEKRDETFEVELLAPSGAVIARTRGRVTIQDDDPNPSPPQADFNGDGEEDILWRNQTSGANQVWIMNGVSYAKSVFLPKLEDPDWQIADTADFNRDGKADVLWRNTWTGENQVWLMDGASLAGVFALPGEGDTDWQIAGVTDFDGDGKPDILWRHQIYGLNRVWLMDGLALKGTAGIATVADTSWEIVGTGDLNMDGKPDLLWRYRATGDLVVWFMNGTAKIGGAALTPSRVDPNWRIVGLSDFDLDGKPDILWRRSTGENAIWVMDGIVLKQGVGLPVVIDPNWKVGAPR